MHDMKYSIWELYRYIRNLVDSVQGHNLYCSLGTLTHTCALTKENQIKTPSDKLAKGS